MTRRARIVLIAGGSVLSLLLVLSAAAVLLTQTAWFHSLVRERIVRVVEDATGGRVEIGAFGLDWRRLRVTADDFAVHGLEPAGQSPLLQARRVQVDFKVTSILRGMVDISALEVEQPRAHLMLFPNGTTNLPEPKVKPRSGEGPLRTVVDLAIGRFDLSRGEVVFESRKTPLDAHGENLRAQVFFNPVLKSYSGQVAVDPLYVKRPPGKPLELSAVLPLTVAAGRIDVIGGRLTSGRSSAEFSGQVEDMRAPRVSVQLNARLALEELDRAFRLRFPPDIRRASPVIAQVSAHYAEGILHIASSRLSLGRSTAEASGDIPDLKTPSGNLHIDATLALGELGRWLRVAAQPEGTLRAGGELKFRGAEDYSFRGSLAARDISLRLGEQRFNGLSGTSRLDASPERVELAGLHVAALDGSFGGSALLNPNARRFRLDGSVNDLNLERLTAAAGVPRQAWNGVVSGPVHVDGNLNDLRRDLAANARLIVTPRAGALPVSGSLGVNYSARRGTLELDHSYLSLPHTRLDLSGSLGQQIQVRLVSTDLNDLLPVLALASPAAPKSLPVRLVNGRAVFDGVVSGTATDPRVNGHLSVASFALDGHRLDGLAADVAASPSGVRLQNGTLTRGTVVATFDGSLGLRDWKPEPASPLSVQASLHSGAISELASAMGLLGAFEGKLDVTAAVSGAFGDPHGNLDFNAVNAVVEGQPFDRIGARLRYASQRVEVSSLQAQSGSAHFEVAGSYQHAPDDLLTGRLEFRGSSNQVRLDQFPILQQRWPGLAGTLDLSAAGAAEVHRAGNSPQVRLSVLDGKLTARTVELNGKPFGDLNLTAATHAGVLSFELASDFANSNLRGSGQWTLSGDYLLSATVTFSRVWLSAVREWLATGAPAGQAFDAAAEGRVTVSGPAFEPEKLKGALEITRLEAGPTKPGATGNLARVTLRNDGPLAATLERSVLRVTRARVTGPETELTASGAVSFQQKNALDLRVNGSAQLDLLQGFFQNVQAAGAVALNATVRGPLDKPAIAGRLDLKDASLNISEMPNAISNANGSIVFGGFQATLQKITAETGGGKIVLSGFIGYGGPQIVFRLRARANGVRVRYPEGASNTADADLTLTGTSDRSTLAGTVTVVRFGFNPRSDFGSVLARTAEPLKTPAAKGGLLEGMRLDVQIQGAPGLQLQSALARDVQAEVNLRLRGTVANPSLLGRIIVSQGVVTFFGTPYDIQQGSISFYNPARIEPVLNIDLETKARGVTVILNVSGPINRLNLTPRSDPPLQFSEIVALLATGRTPTSDPTLLARSNTQPQTWQQMGASALLGEAISSPVSGRLQRLFGVSRLKIDPSFSGVENNPLARLTIEQQITRDVTFTYITNLARSNYQIVRVEWSFSRNWSAVALREENGMVGLDFLYKKRFK